MKMLGIVLTLLVLSAPAYARLGETRGQCDKRYGAPVAKEGPDRYGQECVTYAKQGFHIMIWFYRTKAVTVKYEKPLRGKRVAFTNEDIDALKKANGNGKSWTYSEEMAQKVVGAYWNRSDWNAYAMYESLQRRLTFVDAENAMRIQDAMRKGTSTDGL